MNWEERVYDLLTAYESGDLRCSAWELDFLESLHDYLSGASTRKPSSKQVDIIKKLEGRSAR